MIWFVFYKIPDHFGLISRSKRLSRFEVASGELIDPTIDNLISISKDEDTFLRGSPRYENVRLNMKRSLSEVKITKMKSQNDNFNSEEGLPKNSSPSSQKGSFEEQIIINEGINRSTFAESEHKRSNSNLRKYFTNKNLKKSMHL